MQSHSVVFGASPHWRLTSVRSGEWKLILKIPCLGTPWPSSSGGFFNLASKFVSANTAVSPRSSPLGMFT